jgi:hypothetical protein
MITKKQQIRKYGRYQTKLTAMMVMVMVTAMTVLIVIVIVEQKIYAGERQIMLMGGSNEFGITLTNLHSQPPVVTVGNSFRISGIVTNNSSTPVYLTTSGDSLSATFDKNVIIQKGLVRSFALIKHHLKPGEHFFVSAPSADTYRASSPGEILANVSFRAQVQHEDGSSFTTAILESFAFTIFPGSPA